VSFYTPELNEERYAIERALCDKAREAIRNFWPAHAKGGRVPDAVACHPDYRAADNDMRGRVEQYELMRDTPERFGAYVGAERSEMPGIYHLTTWTGHEIGWCKLGRGWHVGRWGGTMHQIEAHVRGVVYTGRGQGRGMFVGLRRVAKQSKG
jgi:hypothetical protein